MWISFNWLREFVDTGERTAERIAEDLTMRTALIEGIERRGELSEHVVVGRILESGPLADSKRLSSCSVDVGGRVVDVVCGAPNVSAGQNVVVALPGAELPRDRHVEEVEIRGVRSHGMICSESELGIGDDEEGILVLEEGCEPGTPFRELKGVLDVLFDIDNKSVTHRPDLWGHFGFARELAAIHGWELREPELDRELAPGDGEIEVEIEARDLCGRYLALFASGDLSGPSPGWMRRRLAHCGVRPHSLAVDVSNYVMLEIGHPTHPFDRRRIRGGRISVRRALPEERIVTLDGEERALPEGSCVIADAERALAIAGIIGGRDSGVDPSTRDIVLESAWFEPISVRRTSTQLGLRTEALARFEKHLDPEGAETAIRRYSAIMKKVGPSVEIGRRFVARGSRVARSNRVLMRPDRARSKLGVELSDDEMLAILERLGFQVEAETGGLWVRVPTWRATRDVQTEDDLIEEVGRIHGYDRIPATLPRVQCAPATLDPVRKVSRAAEAHLAQACGFAEVLSYPYVEDQILTRSGGDPGDFVRIENPLQQGASRLRRSLVPWLLEFVDRNIRTVDDVRLFESGRVFLPVEGSTNLPDQPVHLAAVRAERVTPRRRQGQVLRGLKGALESVGLAIGRVLTFEPDLPHVPGWAHPGRYAQVKIGERSVGVLAAVDPRVADEFGWKGEVAAFEVDLDRIAACAPNRPGYRPPPRFPARVIDISFTAPFGLAYAAIQSGLESCASHLSRIDLVDEYTSEAIGDGWRSLTLRLAFQSDERTLSDEDVRPEIERVRAWLESNGARIRDGA